MKTHPSDYPLSTPDERVVGLAAALYYAVVLETHGAVGPLYESLPAVDRACLEGLMAGAMAQARAWRDQCLIEPDAPVLTILSLVPSGP